MRYVLLILVIIFAACHSNSSNSSKEFKAIIKDSFNFKWTQIKTAALNFSHINKGVDSFELRIWSSMSISDLKFVTILKYSNSNWQLTETRYWFDEIDNYPKEVIMVLDSAFTKK